MADKIKFKSFLTTCDDNDSCVGSPLIVKHIRYLDHDKNTNLRVTDVVNGQDIINSFADSCDINNIIRTMSLDTFNKLVIDMNNAKQFIDATKLPTNIFELQNFKFEMIDKFNSLPVDLKEIYDNNYYKFIDSIEDGSVHKIVKGYFATLNKRSSDVSVVNNDSKDKGDNKNA